MIPTSPSLLHSTPSAALHRPRVVVTGLGAVTPFGVGVVRLWEGLVAGRSAIRPITGFDAADLPVKIGGEVPDFVAGDHMDRRSAGRMDTFARYAVAAAREAIAMANLTVTDENRNSDRDGNRLLPRRDRQPGKGRDGAAGAGSGQGRRTDHSA